MNYTQVEISISRPRATSMLFANDFQEWKQYVKQFRKVIKEMEESKKERALKRRQDLSALSRDLKAVAEMQGIEESVNSLLLAFYKQQYSTTDLRTFEQWKEAGYIVKKGQTSFMIWATPKATKAEKSDAVKKAEELQKEMERKQKELAECLKVLEQKKDLSAKRTTFLNTLEQIDTAEDVLKEDSTFEVSTYRLIFALGSSSYNNSEIFKISNRELLLNFVDFIREKINKKIAEIEAELVK